MNSLNLVLVIEMINLYISSVSSANTETGCLTYIAVYMGAYPGAPLYDKIYCGTTVPRLIRIPSPNVFIVYQSESKSTKVAFRATVNCKLFVYFIF